MRGVRSRPIHTIGATTRYFQQCNLLNVRGRAWSESEREMTAIGSNAGNGSAGDMTVDPTAADRPTGERGYTGRRTAEIVGISYRQLDYWARTDLVRPSLTDASGSGSRRSYSYRDLLELKVIKTLLDSGLKLESVRQVFTYVREQPGRGHHLGQHRHQRQEVRAGEERRGAHRRAPAGPGRAQRPAAGGGQGRDRRQDRGALPCGGPGRGGPLPVDPPHRRRRLNGVRTSSLDAVHRSLGAKMVPFGGWDMPLSYPDGTLEEHRACRTGAVVFDVSHLGTVRVEGTGRPRPAAGGPHQRPGQDVTGPGAVHPPAGPRRRLRGGRHHRVVAAGLGAAGRLGVLRRDAQRLQHRWRPCSALGAGAVDITDTRAILAVQGPAARERLATVAPEAAAVGRFRVAGFDRRRARRCVVAGTGYTGEDGVECAVPVAAAEEFWDRRDRAPGSPPPASGPVTRCAWRPRCPCTATSSARASPRSTPGWAGSSAGTRATSAGGRPSLASVTPGSPRAPRPAVGGSPSAPGRPGRPAWTARWWARSAPGNFSPILECGIALAFVDPSVQVGDDLAIDVRGEPMPARCVELPFLPKHR